MTGHLYSFASKEMGTISYTMELFILELVQNIGQAAAPSTPPGQDEYKSMQ